jgi:hypothetical protein
MVVNNIHGVEKQMDEPTTVKTTVNDASENNNIEAVAIEPSKQETESIENDNEFSKRVFTEFGNILADGLASLTQTSVCEHEIRLLQDKPFNEFKAIIDEMRQFKLIRPSESPYASSTVLVKKKDGLMRVSVDIGILNELTVKDSYPISKIEDIIARLGQARVFSKLDLASGYH